MQIEVIDQLKIQSPESARWSAIYAGPNYYYGFDAGPVARRAVRYTRPPNANGDTRTALDVGCGEGQDLAFLCESGYQSTGLDFIPNAIEKAARLLDARGHQAKLYAGDLRDWDWNEEFDLVLAVNALQFLGEDALAVLSRVMQSVAIGGTLGLSLFACESGSKVQGGVFFIALQELLNKFDHLGQNRSWQILETAQLQQWNAQSNAPQLFATLIAQRIK